MLAWSRVRLVLFALHEDRATTLGFGAECFEALGGVPGVVLADRMGCLKAGVVANVVVPHPEYVRFASHFGFRPDFGEAHAESEQCLYSRTAQSSCTGASVLLVLHLANDVLTHGKRTEISLSVREMRQGRARADGRDAHRSIRTRA